MTVQPVNAQVQTTKAPAVNENKPQQAAVAIPQQAPDEFVSEVKSAKTSANIAAAAGLGSLAVSGVMLMKAHNLTKTAEETKKVVDPLLNTIKSAEPVLKFAGQVGQFFAPVKKFAVDVGYDKVFETLLQARNTILEHSGETVKALSETAKKMNAETDPAKLEELKKEFGKGLGEAILKMVQTVDGQGAKGIGELAKTPLGEILIANKNGHLNKGILRMVPEDLKKQIEEAVENGKIAQIPEIKAMIETEKAARAARMARFEAETAKAKEELDAALKGAEGSVPPADVPPASTPQA